MPNPMTTDDFIAMTQRVIAKDGFDDYLPTLILPTHSKILALQGVPDDVDIEEASRKWATEKVGDSSEDYYLAFKVDDARFKVVTRIAGVAEERIAPAGADGQPPRGRAVEKRSWFRRLFGRGGD